MKKSYAWLLLVLVILMVVFSPDMAWAAPGGKIVSAMFKTFWGKVLLAILTIIFLPLIVWAMIKEHFAEKRVLRELRRLAAIDRIFDWMTVRDRVTDCYHRVNAAWSTAEMSEAAEWMTSWYWQNQQLAFLNQWERDGLVNHTRIKSITRIRPLFLKFENDEGGYGDGSRLVVSITANMEDYLADRNTGKIVEGAQGYSNTEHVWTFLLQNGKWVVANIEEGATSLTYAGMPLEVPQALPQKGASPSTAI
jgi:hypothetical protein